MKTVYIVIKVGVYRHNICGVYFNYGDAYRSARSEIKAESDDYHDFHIFECPVNVSLNDGYLITKVKRKGEKILVERPFINGEIT